MMYKYLNLDFVGMAASILCAIHCAALPLFLGATAVGGLHVLADPMIEHFVLYISLVVAFLSLVYSYRKHHRRELPMIMAGSGFVLIVAVHLLSGGHEGNHLFLAFGGLLVATAHLINYHWTRSCSLPHLKEQKPQPYT